VAASAVILAMVAGVLVYLIVTYPEQPDGWDRAGLVMYAFLTGVEARSLVSRIRQRWAAQRVPAEVVGYLDDDGDYWIVREDGTLAIDSSGAGLTVDEVEGVYGPLVPVYEGQEMTMECDSCAGTGAGGPASGPETNGRCWDCLGAGGILYVSRRIDL
jgi:hypothetical protein